MPVLAQVTCAELDLMLCLNMAGEVMQFWTYCSSATFLTVLVQPGILGHDFNVLFWNSPCTTHNRSKTLSASKDFSKTDERFFHNLNTNFHLVIFKPLGTGYCRLCEGLEGASKCFNYNKDVIEIFT